MKLESLLKAKKLECTTPESKQTEDAVSKQLFQKIIYLN